IERPPPRGIGEAQHTLSKCALGPLTRSQRSSVTNLQAFRVYQAPLTAWHCAPATTRWFRSPRALCRSADHARIDLPLAQTEGAPLMRHLPSRDLDQGWLIRLDRLFDLGTQRCRRGRLPSGNAEGI